MKFSQVVKTDLTKKYADFKGRASRSEFWWFQLFYISMVILFIVLLIQNMQTEFDIAYASTADAMVVDDAAMSSEFRTLLILFGIFFTITLVPAIAVTIRRFHDRNLSGWSLLGLATLFGASLMFEGWVQLIPALISGYILLSPGTPAENAYGLNPLVTEDQEHLGHIVNIG